MRAAQEVSDQGWQGSPEAPVLPSPDPLRGPPSPDKREREIYRVIQGFDFEELRAAAACSRWNLPPRGGLGLASMAAFFRRRALCIGVSSDGMGGGVFGLSVMETR